MNYSLRPYPPQREIRAGMALQGITVKDVHARTGLSYQYVVRLLNGYCYSVPALAKIRAAVAADESDVDAVSSEQQL
jgi:transcriptional regulator with XRE-family HTH domain